MVPACCGQAEHVRPRLSVEIEDAIALVEDTVATDDEPFPVTPQQWYSPPSCAHIQAASARMWVNYNFGPEAMSFVQNIPLLPPPPLRSSDANVSALLGGGNAQAPPAYDTLAGGFVAGPGNMHDFTSMSQSSISSFAMSSGHNVVTDPFLGQAPQMSQIGIRYPPPPREQPVVKLESLLPSSRAESELAASFAPSSKNQFGSDLISTRFSPALCPSAGSAGHMAGVCKPCAFFHTKGCGNGLACEFCHLCDPGEKKKRHKAKLTNRKSVRACRGGARQGGC